MEQCYRHPDRPGFYYCQKDGNRMCDECACCHSSRIYCQYRSACVIDMLTKQGEISPCRDNPDNKHEDKARKISA
jgi:hypothetical protein